MNFVRGNCWSFFIPTFCNIFYRLKLRDALFKRTLDFFQTGGGPPPPSVWTSSGQYFLKAISPIKNNHNYGPKVPKIWWYTFNWVKNDQFCTSGSQILFFLNSKCLKILPQNFRIGGRPPPLWVKVQSKPAFFKKGIPNH